MVSALVHGNELCGAIVLDRLHRMDFRPLRGTLTLGFMNVEAYLSFDPGNPHASRCVDEDFNRLWSEEVLDGGRRSCELARARQVRPIIDQVDVLLDLHSMHQCATPLMLCGPSPRGRALAMALGAPEYVVADAGHAAGKRMRDFTPFVDPHSRRNALLMECGLHWRRDTPAVAFDITVRFLHHLGMLDRELLEQHALPPPAVRRVVEVVGPVTIETDHFRFVEPFTGMEVISEAGTVIAYDAGRPVRTPFDDCVLIMPSTLKRRGESAVRLGRFV
jgi:predicted deacylase